MNDDGYALCVDQLRHAFAESDDLRAALKRLYEAGLRAHSKSQDLIDALEATAPLFAPARAEATTTTK